MARPSQSTRNLSRVRIGIRSLHRKEHRSCPAGHETHLVPVSRRSTGLCCVDRTANEGNQEVVWATCGGVQEPLSESWLGNRARSRGAIRLDSPVHQTFY